MSRRRRPLGEEGSAGQLPWVTNWVQVARLQTRWSKSVPLKPKTPPNLIQSQRGVVKHARNHSTLEAKAGGLP